MTDDSRNEAASGPQGPNNGPNQEKGKAKPIAAIAVAVAALILVAVGVLFLFLRPGGDAAEDAAEASDREKASQLAETIRSTLSDTSFTSASKQEQVEQAGELLEKAFEDGLIYEEALFDEDSQMYSFAYADGVLGGIDLLEYGGDTNGGMSEEDASGISDRLSSLDEPILLSSQLSQNPSKALILDAFEESRDPIYEELERRWDSCGFDASVVFDPTVEDMRSIGGEDLVMLSMHGTVRDGQPALVLREVSDSAKDERYSEELSGHTVAKVWNGNWLDHVYYILPGFFSASYRDGGLEGAIVMSESCCFYGRSSDSEPDKAFSDDMRAVGVRAVCGMYNSVNAAYSIFLNVSVVERMKEGIGIQRALTKVQEDCGISDERYRKSGSPAIAFEYGDSDASLWDIDIFSQMPSQLSFSSGVGAWSTVVQVNSDGSFTGTFNDEDAGALTQRHCDFSGRFSDVFRLDDYAFQAAVEDLTLGETPGKQETVGALTRTYTEPYGLAKATTVNIYVPGTPISMLEEECADWYYISRGSRKATVLDCWCIYNVDEQYAFFSKETSR